ncbi:MAG TPA: ABC transporter ATP-binding protein [Acidimicrobiales bacterium]
MNALEVRGLTKDFGSIRALDGLDLDVERGEVFGWLGPNGAGKTTTVRLLLDFIRPTAGTATILGCATSDPRVRGRIGYLPGDLHLDPSYTGDEVFRFYGALRGGVDLARLDELLERFSLDPTRRIGELSTGNRRKVGIVQAFVHRPDLLILDEPTSGLDPLLQHEFNDVVRASVADGATVFLSSHVLPEVEALATRVGILRRGRLVAVVTVESLRRQARQRLSFVLERPPGASPLASIPGVVDSRVADVVVDVVVEGSAAGVVATLAPFGIARVTSRDDDLEDVFLGYYETPEAGA